MRPFSQENNFPRIAKICSQVKIRCNKNIFKIFRTLSSIFQNIVIQKCNKAHFLNYGIFEERNWWFFVFWKKSGEKNLAKIWSWSKTSGNTTFPAWAVAAASPCNWKRTLKKVWKEIKSKEGKFCLYKIWCEYERRRMPRHPLEAGLGHQVHERSSWYQLLLLTGTSSFQGVDQRNNPWTGSRVCGQEPWAHGKRLRAYVSGLGRTRGRGKLTHSW